MVAYTIENSPNMEIAEEILVIYNGNKDKISVPLPEGEWEIYINGEKAGCEVLGTAEGSVDVDCISAMVLTRGISENARQIGETSPTDGHGDGKSNSLVRNLLLCIGGGCLAAVGILAYKRKKKS